MIDITIIIIAAVLALIVVFLSYKLYEHHQRKRFFKKVAWCVTNDSHIYRCNLNLIDWLHNIPFYSLKKKPADCFFPNADKIFPIYEKYRIQGDEERNIAKEILEQYQQDLIQRYFSGNVYITCETPKKITEAEFFIVSLREFLEENEFKTTFNGKKMYEIANYKSHGCWGVPLFTATYVLTDYAVVYHKMYYIVQMYSLTLRKNPFDTDTVYFQSSEDTKKVLDTRIMKVSRL